jgi:hypothetical protein
MFSFEYPDVAGLFQGDSLALISAVLHESFGRYSQPLIRFPCASVTRNQHWPVQDPSDLCSRPVAIPGSRGVCSPGMG